jgi:hypothetical protein
MTAHPSLRRRATTVALGSATAVALAWAVPSTASAHPGVYDSETCAQSLTRVWVWPGPISDDGPPVFSDGYESYLLRQRPCDAPPPVPVPDRDDSRVGHAFPAGSERTC